MHKPANRSLSSAFQKAAHQIKKTAAIGLISLSTLFAVQCTTVKSTSAMPRPTVEKIEEPLLTRPPLDSCDVSMRPVVQTITDSKLLDIDYILRGKNDDFTVQNLVYPSATGDTRSAYLTLPPGDGPHPLIIVFPALGSGGTISELLAKGYTREGYATLRMVEYPPLISPGRSIEDVFDQFRHTVADARALADYLGTLPEIDAEKTGVAGLSLGALMAATTIGVDQNIDAGAFMLGAGNLPELLYDSKQKRIAKFTRDYMADSLSTRTEFIKSIKPYASALDPLRYAASVDPKTVLMITGRFDKVMPKELSRELWKELGEPEWKTMPTGHYPALYIYWMINQSSKFFDKTLKADQTATMSSPAPSAQKPLTI